MSESGDSDVGCSPLSCGNVICNIPSDCTSDVGEKMNIRLQADQPVVAVPVYQEIQRTDKYIEVPQLEVTDTIIPRVYSQSALHDVPQMEIQFEDKNLSIEEEKILERDVDVPINMGYAPQFLPKWDIREVPRPVPKYEGEQQIIEVEVPQIEYKDRYVEKEVIVDIQEKVIPKVTEVVKEVEVMQYEWKEQYQDVPVYKYVPKFDVELDCPPALIVPYPETRYVKDEPETQRFPCGLSACCYPEGPGAPVVKSRQIHTEVIGDKNKIPQLQYPNIGTTQYQQDYVYKGQLMGDKPGQAPFDTQLTPGPVFPQATPQAHVISGMTNQQLEQQTQGKKSLWNWLWGKESEEDKQEGVDTQGMGYPAGMPADFAAAFQQQMASSPRSTFGHKSDQSTSKAATHGASELEPSVVYRGAVSKPPIFGGELESISFKLHAIEIHQFVPLPNVEVPEFVKALPEGILPSDVSNLTKFFGPVPSGWADPDVTGIPAPMMSDILTGNVQNVAASNPLVNQLSSQFIKQGYVPGGTREYTENPTEPQQPIVN